MSNPQVTTDCPHDTSSTHRAWKAEGEVRAQLVDLVSAVIDALDNGVCAVCIAEALGVDVTDPGRLPAAVQLRSLVRGQR